jgi:uncharacterized integral membrane protein
MKTKLIATVILLIFVIVFMAQNTAAVGIRLLFWEIDVPRSLLVFMLLLIGALIGWFTRAMYRLSRNAKTDL